MATKGGGLIECGELNLQLPQFRVDDANSSFNSKPRVTDNKLNDAVAGAAFWS